jgi:L-alanine-DL-glutamate epimerase-like enolase superfamily enzyme
MQVTGIQLVPYALPFERPYVTARGTLERREMLLVRLQTDEGIEGLGEAVPLSLRGGADLDAIARGVRGRDRRVHPRRRRAPAAGPG